MQRDADTSIALLGGYSHHAQKEGAWLVLLATPLFMTALLFRSIDQQACDAFALFEKTLLLDPTHKKARAYLRDHNKHRGCPSDYGRS